MAQITGILAIFGIVLLSGGFLSRKFKRFGWILAGVFWSLAFFFLAGSGYSYWYYHRPQPDPIQNQTLFQGVTYSREIYTEPRPNVVHIVSIDLDAPGISLFVTPDNPKEGRALQARTTSQFVKEFGVQMAINGGFFYPFYVKGPLWFYPHVGNPVDVYGLSMAQGRQYSPPEPGYNTLYVSQQGDVSIGAPIGTPYYALSGFSVFLKEGELDGNFTGRYYETSPSPRTVVALDKPGRQLSLFVVDGRQPSHDLR